MQTQAHLLRSAGSVAVSFVLPEHCSACCESFFLMVKRESPCDNKLLVIYWILEVMH